MLDNQDHLQAVWSSHIEHQSSERVDILFSSHDLSYNIPCYVLHLRVLSQLVEHRRQNFTLCMRAHLLHRENLLRIKYTLLLFDPLKLHAATKNGAALDRINVATACKCFLPTPRVCSTNCHVHQLLQDTIIAAATTIIIVIACELRHFPPINN